MQNKPTTSYRPPDSKASPARKEPEPAMAPGFGATLYDLICRHRLPDGSAWTLSYFATVVGAGESRVRAWLNGVPPDAEELVRIGQALLVDGPALLEGEIHPPTLPPTYRTTGEHHTLPEGGSG